MTKNNIITDTNKLFHVYNWLTGNTLTTLRIQFQHKKTSNIIYIKFTINWITDSYLLLIVDTVFNSIRKNILTKSKLYGIFSQFI